MDCVRIAILRKGAGEVYFSPFADEKCGFVRTRLYKSSKGVYAVGEEKGGAKHGEASVVCAIDGSPWGHYDSVKNQKGWINKFRFRTSRPFIIVQMNAKSLKIQEHCLRWKSSGLYELTTTELLADVCLQTIATGNGGPVCEKYAAAIGACMTRLSSSNCQRVFYHDGDE